ncbi:MAG: fumarylacetoacetate hydrolase family protein [Labilithrix sp.]|nr:fumarylacetoacetate hydrolase family protein [Labilithrix sp.]MCW5810435.1 fumarylacetoacetate hydrolase family protein [Labilithrix sp.]
MRVGVLEKNGDRAWFALDGDRARRFDGSPFEGARLGSHEISWSAADLRAPVRPSKIICVGRNYAAHAKELGNEVPKEPLLFLKAPSSVVGPGGAIVLPKESEKVEHEAELGVVIGRRVKRAAREQALDSVYGYTCVCDVTARDLQKKDGQWSRAKGFDTFCPVGPWIETELDPKDLAVSCAVDGVLKQQGRTSQMIFDVPTLIAYISAAMTLEPGDLIVTGTPEGVGPLAAGNKVVVSVEGIGELSVGVVGA